MQYLPLEWCHGGCSPVRSAARFLSKNFFSPILSLLFPGIKKDSPAAQAVCLNLAANLLGLGAAAAPAGICAVSQFQRACLDPSVACDNSILLILLNTASLQLIPTTAAMLRLQAGSAAPMEILPAYGWHPFFRSPPVFLTAKGMAHIANAKTPFSFQNHKEGKHMSFLSSL